MPTAADGGGGQIRRNYIRALEDNPATQNQNHINKSRANL
jgi:hypothetical protein